MKKIVFIVVAIVLSACRFHIAETDLPKLNGYWEVTKAVTPEGEVRTYEANTSIDYWEMNDKRKGFRKKIQTDLLGNMETSDDVQPFEIQIIDNQWAVTYTNDDKTWVETLIGLSDEGFTLRNAEGFEYFYKKWKPIVKLDSISSENE